MRVWQNFFTEEDVDEFDASGCPANRVTVIEYLNAKIREALEAAPKVYGENEYRTYQRAETAHDTHTARLVDVKPIEKGET